MQKLLYVSEIILTCVSLICGILCLKYPKQTIRFQQFFYSKINWRMEPIDLKKEIRNTRIMGIFLIAVAIAAFWFLT